MRLVQRATTAEDDANSHEKGLAIIGLRLENPTTEDREFRVWPDNEEAVSVFGCMLSQFNVADGGVYLGLKYESLPHVYRSLRLGPRRQRDVFPSVQVMEAAAVTALNAKA